MKDCIEHGIKQRVCYQGPLKSCPSCRQSLYRLLEAIGRLAHDPMYVIDWVNMFALAVNEENAAGGRVVTAPTNGACGIVPAVLSYYENLSHL